MKTLKLKKNNSKNKFLITIILNVIICLLLVNVFSNALSSKIITMSKKLIKKNNTMIIKGAFDNEHFESYDTDKLILIIKNSKDEIVEVDFKIDECENLMKSVVRKIHQEINEYNINGYAMYIPLGYISNNPLLINLGPKIPLKVSVTNIASGNITIKIKEFGINNALIEMYVEISMIIDTVLPLNTEEVEIVYGELVASKIITGTVPNFYNGSLNKKSETINLPIEEEV